MSHVSDLQLEDLPGVQSHLISKLRQAGIQSVLDRAVSVPQELVASGQLEIVDVKVFLVCIQMYERLYAKIHSSYTNPRNKNWTDITKSIPKLPVDLHQV
jgi:hypothetical protein